MRYLLFLCVADEDQDEGDDEDDEDDGHDLPRVALRLFFAASDNWLWSISDFLSTNVTKLP